MTRYEIALELPKVLDLLAAETASADAAAQARALSPSRDEFEVTRRLNETADAQSLLLRFGAPSFGSVKNISAAAKRAATGSPLSLRELLDVAELLRVFRGICEWRTHLEGETALDRVLDGILPNKFLEEKITHAILSDDTIADSASPELANIRRKTRAASSRVRESLDKLIRSPSYQKALQDPIVTLREGRFVVPVKAECRADVPGLVHGASSTGATVFVEPMAAVEANNELRLLAAKEEAEIERIIAALSAEVGSFCGSLCAGYEQVVALDLIFAKAHLADKMKATRPELRQDGFVKLRHARHPLIDPKTVVPIDVELGGEFDTLVITGPNTGGKTVTLKTVGLLSLMTLCGLLPPTDDGSSISIFSHILVDVGDEQSIEQSLSTFSAHMKNLIDILEAADHRSLVLVDELGAGTDPVEGAALAVAILERLREQGAKIIATTHYAELKAYAVHESGVENGSCEFDVATLRPTYRLLVGVPGRSNAFAISERLGIAPDVVERAKTLVSGDDRKMEDVVVRLDEQRHALEQELADAKQSRTSAERDAAAAKAHAEQLEKERQKALDDARAEAKKIVERARLDSERLIEELDRLKKQKNAADFSANATAAKSKLRRQLSKMEDALDPVVAPAVAELYVLPRPLKIGDAVTLADLGKEGTVLSLPDKDDLVEVQAGVVRTRVPLANLRLCEAASAKKQTEKATKKLRTVKPAVSGDSSAELGRARGTGLELDLRGMAVDEALPAVDLFLDRAVLAGVPAVTLIHGKGTGVLRSAVQQHLRTHPSVKSYRLGKYGEGEDGVTIAELK